MSCALVIPQRLRHRIASFGLADAALVEVYERLRDLQNDPAASLIQIRDSFEGMGHLVQFIDPDNRICVHTFLFQILYSQDEERLLVPRVVHSRRIG